MSVRTSNIETNKRHIKIKYCEWMWKEEAIELKNLTYLIYVEYAVFFQLMN